jgi:hypothetical protein
MEGRTQRWREGRNKDLHNVSYVRPICRWAPLQADVLATDWELA